MTGIMHSHKWASVSSSPRFREHCKEAEITHDPEEGIEYISHFVVMTQPKTLSIAVTLHKIMSVNIPSLEMRRDSQYAINSFPGRGIVIFFSGTAIVELSMFLWVALIKLTSSQSQKTLRLKAGERQL